jgi:acetylornithine deacetylase
MPWLGLCQQAGIDTIICDPDDISRAHRSNEYIETGELAACQQMIEHLAA